ncbi:SGNH/GDSL hydrolase family protein [Thalassoglobus sp. JC818]|uniref:SGNH/GDSL hydrolase family protein n=1 Tax=Thalassoglobus sp. JC818 TaxID=3232136 RepID=UPI003458A10B
MSRPDVSRRQFLQVAGLTTVSSLTLPVWAQSKPSSSEVNWHDVRDWGIEGKGWDDTAKYFDRLPALAEGVVRSNVWNLSRHSAGMLVRFKTDATDISADYAVTSSKLAMPHMPATGVSGLDLYARDDEGELRWLSVVKPDAQHVVTKMCSGIIPGPREFCVYLPLYNGTESLKIGVPKGATFEPIEPRREKPIVFYGTSITHGACASRPGMPHPAILGRRLNQPVINLGFSGNGRLEKEVGRFLVELDPSVYVIDCLPNLLGPQVEERAAPLVRQLRKARPTTPILLVEDRTYANTPFYVERQQRHEHAREALRKAYETLKADGDDQLFYLPGEDLLGEDRDDTTDGSHPSDLGFYRQANAFEPVLRKILASNT